MLNVVSEIYHRIFRKPYRLTVVYDSGYKDMPVIVLLHGIASDSSTWNALIPNINNEYRVIAIDLLGFGASHKPIKETYNLNSHSKSVVLTLKKLGIKNNVIIIGHSMGGLIAIDIAKKHTKLVNKIITVGMPLYNKNELTIAINDNRLANKNLTNGLFRVYEYLLNNQDSTLKRAQNFMKLSSKINTFTLTKETWIPFKKSLKSTIMEQDTIDTIKHLNKSVHIIYGSMDIFIMSKNYKLVAKSNNNIFLSRYIGGHLVTKPTVKKIIKALQNNS